MKIIIVNCVFKPEPIVSAQLGYDLAISLSKLNHTVIVVCPYPTRPHGFKFNEKFDRNKISVEQSDNIKIVRIPSYTCSKSNIIGRFRESISFGKKSTQYIYKNEIDTDIIYANTWPLFAQRSIVKLGKRINKPTILHIQDIYPESFTNKLPKLIRAFVKSIFMPLEKYNLQNANKVIAISPASKQILSETRKILSNKITVVFNWQDETQFSNYNKTNEKDIQEPFVFMYLGNIGPVAGVEFLIQSFGNAQLNNTILIIAGSGSYKSKCIELAKNYPDSTIQFLNVPDGKVADIQSKADVMLLPLIKGAAASSIPSKLPAYMFSAKPIIATVDEKSDIASFIKEAACGWIGPPEDKEWLMECLKKVVTINKFELNQKGKAGSNFASKIFSKEKNVQMLTQIILDNN